jgi:hypothetical protein
MKTLICRFFSLAVFGMLVAVPAAADDVGVFPIGQDVLVGDVQLPAGVYAFRVSDRGHVLVLDESQTKIVAAVLTQRHALKLRDYDMSGTLAYDRTVRELSIGDWQYTFSPGKEAGTLASLANQPLTVVAQIR